MRIQKLLFTSVALTTLFAIGLTAVGSAQDTRTIVETNVPVIESTIPTNGESNVDLNSTIEITFSTEMDSTTINKNTLMLHASSENRMHDDNADMQTDHRRDRSEEHSENSMQSSVNGTISYSNKVAVFTPSEELKEGTLYTFTVTNDVKSSENIALEMDYSWSFTTMGTAVSANTDYQNDEYGIRRSGYSESATDTTKSKLVNLGRAGQFVILAKADINNESDSEITGHIGEGSDADKMKNEKAYADSVRQRTDNEVLVMESNKSDSTSPDVSEAIEDMISAYNAASTQKGEAYSSHNNESITSIELTAGVHEWSDSLHIDSDVTLSGSADDVWIMMVGDDLTIDENIVFTLADGAQADNVFWFVDGEVNIGENAQFEGIIMSMNEITLEKGAKINGRMFSQASINLDDNIITEPRGLTSQTSLRNR